MFNHNSIVSALKLKLSTGAFERYLATDHIILQEYTGEFMLGIYKDRDWKLSYLGDDTHFCNIDDVYTYFDLQYGRLFEPPAIKYLYGNGGLVIKQDHNSALITLKQTEDRYAALFRHA